MSKESDASIIAAFERLSEAQDEAARAKEKAASAKLALGALIRPGQVRAGIRHETRPHVSISYKAALDEAREALIPVTKLPALAKIIAANTNETPVSFFTRDKEEKS